MYKFHGEIPKRLAFHGFKPCFPHFFHIKCPVLWRNPSSLRSSVASLVSSEGIWKQFATKGEQWGRRVRIYTEIQRYYIILYYICVNMYIYIYDYFHIYVYIYIWSHTHTRGNPPGSIEISSLVNIVCFAPSSASPHRHWKQKKQWIWGPTPTQPQSRSTFLGEVVWLFWFLGLPPKPKVGLQFFLLKAGLLFLGGSSPQPKTGHPKWEYACSFWCFVGMWWAKNLNMCMVHGYIYVMFLGSTRCKTLQTCSKNL